MSHYTYEQKNKENFEKNTLSLHKALQEIQRNQKLKVTVAQLSVMTGIHRNTIANRIWPVQELKKIKEKRKIQEKIIHEQEVDNINDSKKRLEEKLIQSQNEIIYWFNEYQDMKHFFQNSSKRFENMKESRNYYKRLYETDRKSLVNAQQEIKKLRELLELKVIISDQFRH